MKVGTDGVLLGAWADLGRADSILDIGCGTGLISLMAAQRNAHAIIDAIEIDPEATRQAKENTQISPWNNRINVYNTSLFDFVPNKQYDSIVCNPPFFINSTKAPDTGRTLARHNDSLPHRELIIKTVSLLKKNGNFCVILPPNEADLFIRHAADCQLYPQRITHIRPTPNQDAKRQLIKFIFEKCDLISDHLIVELTRHQYSEDYIRLTHDFYLHL